jgi:hypothetical protein
MRRLGAESYLRLCGNGLVLVGGYKKIKQVEFHRVYLGHGISPQLPSIVAEAAGDVNKSTVFYLLRHRQRKPQQYWYMQFFL